MSSELLILEALLDKYERSQDGLKGLPPSRSVFLRLYGKGSLDLVYDVENSQSKAKIHQAAAALEQQDLITVQWLKGAEGNIIAKILLNNEKLAEAYQLTKRTPAASQTEKTLDLMQQTLSLIPAESWAAAYLQEEIAYTLKSHRIRASFAGRDENIELWLACLQTAAGLEDTITERAFSMLLADSKTFEKQFKSRLAAVIKKYVDNDMTDSQALEYAGIVRYPDTISFCGPLNLLKDGRTVLTGADFDAGLTIACSDFKNFSLDASQTAVVTSIENKANYLEYIASERQPDELVIYHAGQVGPDRLHCFKKLAASLNPDCCWRHWSDIDYGGLLMLARLRQHLACTVQPYRMGIAVLQNFKDLAAHFSADYGRRLEKLLANPYLQTETELIQFMLLNQIRLEQEAWLLETPGSGLD